MNQQLILVVMAGVIFFLLIYIAQTVIEKRKFREAIREISQKLDEILSSDTDEKIMLFTDNTIIKKLSNEINKLLLDRQRMRAEYKKYENSSKKMLSNISHDLKTPLTVILGYLEIMHMEAPNDITLQKVEDKAKQVIELINQFFSWVKIEGGDVDFKMEKINISELCKESILGFYDILKKEEFLVEISVPKQGIFVEGDKVAISRILLNLLSNAVRYGCDGKYIGLIIRSEGAFVYIDVIDKGKGVEEEFADNVFERLFTMEDSRNRKIQGNGLGLTIAKSLALQIGGDIFLSSEPNIKTVFTVKLKKYKFQLLSEERNL